VKVIVCGGGGYLGIPLCEELARRGHEVLALDWFYFGKIPTELVTCQKADIRSIDKFNGQYDAVVDLACLSNDAAADIDPELTTSINVRGACRLATLAKDMGIKKYIYSSSCSVYGRGEHDGLTETADCNPLTAYARSKVRVEDKLRAMASPNFDPIILRNATVFGVAPRMRFDLSVNIMTLRAWRDNLICVMGSGKQYRPFIHLLDVVRAFVMALEHKNYLNQTFNVGSDDMNRSIDELAILVESVFPHAAIHQIPDDADKRSYHVSFLKIRETFAFKARHDITEGICEVRQALIDGKVSGDDETSYTAAWYRKLMGQERRLNASGPMRPVYHGSYRFSNSAAVTTPTS
jgi:nucleoside-diphosphate-sugar epimerase